MSREKATAALQDSASAVQQFLSALQSSLHRLHSLEDSEIHNFVLDQLEAERAFHTSRLEVLRGLADESGVSRLRLVAGPIGAIGQRLTYSHLWI
jgi:hypothetical protein